MICDFYGGPMDGGSMIIPDDRCDVGTVHEVIPPAPDEDCSTVPMHTDFADPEAVATRTITAFYRLNGIVNRCGMQIAHLDFVGYYK